MASFKTIFAGIVATGLLGGLRAYSGAPADGEKRTIDEMRQEAESLLAREGYAKPEMAASSEYKDRALLLMDMEEAGKPVSASVVCETNKPCRIDHIYKF